MDASSLSLTLVEVETGLLPGAAPGTVARPGYDPATTSLAERQRAKAVELEVGVRTIERKRARYQEQGLWGLVDQRDAVLTGFLICAYRWNFTEIALDRAWLNWRHRADILIPPGTEADTFSASRLFAATYPEAVSLAGLIGSLHWRCLAAGDPDDQHAFAAEIGRRLGLRDYRPMMSKDPIAHWIEQDCWQPPSLPNNDYHSLKTFGGKTFRKPDPRSEDTRLTSAHWFATHRRGGDAMLHHRSLNPVVIRDWSHKMELFAGTLDISASVSFEARRTINGGEHHTTEYLRPTPVSSPYLDTAVEPVPWPRRDGPRPPTGARPWLPHEKPKPFYGRGPLRSTSQR